MERCPARTLDDSPRPIKDTTSSYTDDPGKSSDDPTNKQTTN